MIKTRVESESSRQVGVSIKRVDGVDKVTGKALYVDDRKVPGMLFGKTLRSKIPHGIFKGLHKDPSFDWSDVTVATAKDIPGQNYIKLIENDQVCLVKEGGTIRHHDEALALVAAPTLEKANEALRHLKPDVSPLPALFDMNKAETSEVKLWKHDNVYKSFLIEKGDELEAAFASADLILEGEYNTPAQEQMYIEPQGMMAHYKDGTYHIVGSMQCPYYIHKAMVPLLGCGESEVIIEQAVTGGGFGGKEEYPSMLAGHAAVLSKACGAPVKMIYSREEDIAATTKRHPSKVVHKMGFKKDGTIVAIDVDVLFDGGAYLTLSPVVLSRGVLHAAGPYKCKHTRIKGRVVATNHPPHGAFRGFGAPQTTFAYERQIQKAARALNLDAFAIREKNALQQGDTTATEQKLDDSVGSLDVLDAVKQKARPLLVPQLDEWRFGRGLAFYNHGAGFTGSGESHLEGKAKLVLNAGGKFEVLSSSTDIGQGAATVFVQIASSALGVSPNDVSIATPSTNVVPDSGPTVASRTCMVVGSVVEKAAKRLRAKIKIWGDEHLPGKNTVETATAMFEAEGEQSEIVTYRPPQGVVWDEEHYKGSAYPVYGWAACLVDVAVNRWTYEAKILQCVHAVDVGKAIHPIIVKGQIEGGTMQALGWALWENVLYADGKVVNNKMSNCIVPTFADAPELSTIIVEKPYNDGPFGAKGVGEIPMDGPAAAVANAIEDAIGKSMDALPCSPEAIYKAWSRP